MTFLDRLLSSLKNERGAYMVFFAILIPILFGCAGLAVDLGNGFARHARLQKAADAAALAGAATFAMNQETVDSHPKADAQAEIYAKVNWGEWESIISKAAPGEDGGWCIVLSRSSSGVDTYDIYQICGY